MTIQIEQTRDPLVARHYVTLRLMRANLANHIQPNSIQAEIGKKLFKSFLMTMVKNRRLLKGASHQTQTNKIKVHSKKNIEDLVEKIKRILKTK